MHCFQWICNASLWFPLYANRFMSSFVLQRVSSSFVHSILRPMANCVCGGMKTLGVAMGQPGRTDQIIADTWHCVDPLKPKFTDNEPSIKLDAPVITEIVDLPATIQGYILKDFTLKFIRVSYIHPRLYSWGFLIEFNKKWAISIQGNILKDVYKHPKLYSSGFLIESNKKWAISIQGYILKDVLLDLMRNELFCSDYDRSVESLIRAHNELRKVLSTNAYA